MTNICKQILWSNGSLFQPKLRRAVVSIVTNAEDELDSGQKDLLKIELRETFPEANDRDIRFERTHKRCVGAENKWALVWRVPRPGIPLGEYRDWRQFRRPRYRESFIDRLDLMGLLESLKSWRLF